MSKQSEIEWLDELWREVGPEFPPTLDARLMNSTRRREVGRLLLNLWPEIKAVLTEVQMARAGMRGESTMDHMAIALDDLNAAIRRELGEPEGER